MALDMLVDSASLDSDLTVVANAIRAKNGTSAQLAFPSEFISEIGNISGGWVKTLTAVFSQETTRVFTTDGLDDLRDRLVVTATYQDDTSETVDAYELSGTLVAGTSTIVVTYGDKSTTFTATVTEAVDITPALSSYSGASCAVNVNSADNSILVYTTSNGNWRVVQTPLFNWDEGYGYRLTGELEYFQGNIYAGFRASSETFAAGAGYYTSSRKFVVDKVLSDTSYYTATGRVGFILTNGSGGSGRAVFRNIKCIKYSTATPANALNLLMGGESA